MNIVITGFKGKNNSAKILLDYLLSKSFKKIIYLRNDFTDSEHQIKKLLRKGKIDYIFEIGQKPKIKKIYIETNGNNNNIEITTKFNYEDFNNYLNNIGIDTIISRNAGNYLCNNIYYYTLKYIEDKKLDTKVIFIHTPIIKNFDYLKEFGKVLLKYIKKRKLLS